MPADLAIVGVDTGGTFTDFVWIHPQGIRTCKVLSTPAAPERAIIEGLRQLGLRDRPVRMVHGSTVATNAVLQDKGVATLYICNQGMNDLLTIGRQARPDIYDLNPPPAPAPVPADHCLAVTARIDAGGKLLRPLTEQDRAQLCRRLSELAPQAVAVNLLFSYLCPAVEQAVREALPNDLFVSLSSEVLPVAGEYERGVATWLNAWVGPLIQGYIDRLLAALPEARVKVMQSSGDVIAAGQAKDHAVRLLLSGPAGGLVAAQLIGRETGARQLLAFDMGGTSTDVALIDGVPALTREGRIGRYPVAVPMVDIHTIGAGGGSIAYLDEGGMLQVGPQSAGADPGPACYGKGGRQATVSDAHLVLGHLPEQLKLGGYLPLHATAAQRAVDELAAAMGMDREQTARGILRIANEHMAQALRVISVERGIDPSDFTLLAFGGAGGLHVCALARSMNMRRALVPAQAGVLSALGMLAAPPGRQLTRASAGLLGEQRDDAIEQSLRNLAEAAVRELQDEGIARQDILLEFSLDLRYRGQSACLNLGWSSVDGCKRAFQQLHQQRYGHQVDAPVELVNLCASVRGSAAMTTLPPETRDDPVPAAGQTNVYWRSELKHKQPVFGPALIVDRHSCVLVERDWRADPDRHGNLVLTWQPAETAKSAP